MCMSTEVTTDHSGWEDGHGHFGERRAQLDPEAVASAMALSRALSKEAITSILSGFDMRYDEAVETGASDEDLHIIAQERDVYHMAQLHAVDVERPPAA